MNIYFVEAETIWPVGVAGAVVVANNTEEALYLVTARHDALHRPKQPDLIGIADEKYNVPKIIFINTTEY